MAVEVRAAWTGHFSRRAFWQSPAQPTLHLTEDASLEPPASPLRPFQGWSGVFWTFLF
jgi:hypothetical protein